MSTSDDKRREVAKKMREYDVAEFKESAIVPFLECLGLGYTGWRGILDELADLIDRPTCRDVGDSHHVLDFVCSECGCELDVNDREGEPTMWNGGTAMVPKYCPNCGAEVES